MSDRQRAADVPVRPAATVMLVRDGTGGLEVFMLQRSMSASFAHGQYAFPGGAVDELDHSIELEEVCDSASDAAASQRLGLPNGGLAWLVATIRECFEEAGVLLARSADSDEVLRFDASNAEAFAAARTLVHDGEVALRALCRDHDLRLLTDRIHLVDHWITPMGSAKRFDTRFFVAAAPSEQEPLHDDKETIASLWVRPDEALRLLSEKQIQMFPPTIASLRFLRRFRSVEETIEASAAVGIPRPIEPKFAVGDDGKLAGVVRPGEEGYDEMPLPEFVVA